MTKSIFIHTLKGLLAPLNSEERDKFISYYDEIIEDYKESGETEEAVINRIGTPQSIAEHILSEQESTNTTTPAIGTKVFNIVLLVLGFPLWGSILLSAILLLLSAIIVIWCIPFTTGCCSFAFFFAALYSIIGSPFMMADVLSVGIVQLGVGIVSIGVSILLGLVTLKLSNTFIQVTKKLTLQIVSLSHKKVVKL